MSELFSAAELIGALLKVGKGTYQATKFAGKVAYGAYAKSKEQQESARLQRQAIVDETGQLERLANIGVEEALYEYGINLYYYGLKYGYDKEKNEGLYKIRISAANGYELAKDFLKFLDEN